jgi:REP element-mobilizing transposase RayT
LLKGRQNHLLILAHTIPPSFQDGTTLGRNQTLRVWLISSRAFGTPRKSIGIFIVSFLTHPTNFPRMPSTHLSLHFHIVFSTKDRHPFITDDWKSRAHEYLGGLIRGADAIPEAIGGTADHVHLLVGLRATHSLATFVQDIKQSSSHWVHEVIGNKNFSWQPGYGAFTVSVSNCDGVKAYIANQVEHHWTKSFQDEYVIFLQRHGVAYEEKHLW